MVDVFVVTKNKIFSISADRYDNLEDFLGKRWVNVDGCMLLFLFQTFSFCRINDSESLSSVGNKLKVVPRKREGGGE